MVILLSYSEEIPKSGGPVRILSEEEHLCPSCGGGLLFYRDCVRRSSKQAGGMTRWFLIPRSRCSACRSIHRMLPLFLCPFKHYVSSVISGVLTGNQPFHAGQAEDYPCEMTMDRWRSWAGEDFCRLADNPLYQCFADSIPMKSNAPPQEAGHA